MNNFFNHLKIISLHRKYVLKMCFKMGIPLQGLLHDLSKYSITEMSISKYYDGKRSPHEVVREKIGYSPSWLNHYHKNKHHWQFWLDIEDYPQKVKAIKMPYKYVVEMFCDMVGASKAYRKEKFMLGEPLKYYEEKCKGKRLMHEDSENLLVCLFVGLATSNSEADFLKIYKKHKREMQKSYGENK